MSDNGQGGAMVRREEFGANQIATIAETASSAMAEQAKAQVQARYVMAIQRPRDIDTVRVRLLKECKRPGFAAVARYNKPIGRGVQGPSIRFAEAAIRCMTNILPETATIYDDREKRIIRVSVTDLEANVTYSTDVTVSKTVERLNPSEGQIPISARTNARGQTTFLVTATEDDLLNKQNALISKALRTNALRLIPGDILDESMDQVIATLKDAAARDPDAERKKLADAFAALNVTPAMLADYLGHVLGTVSPAELVDLRATYQAIRDGEATWAAVLESKGGGDPATAKAAPTTLDQAAAKARAKRKPEPDLYEVWAAKLRATRTHEAWALVCEDIRASGFPEELALRLSLVQRETQRDPATGEIVPPAGGRP